METPDRQIQTVRMPRQSMPEGMSASSMRAPLLTRPIRWLGARSPFGLVLPDAQPSPQTMYAPRGVWLDRERLIVCDSGNHRILIWHSLPTIDQAPADVVLCQPSFTSEGPAAHGRGPENGVHLPTGVVVACGKLLVADAWHHRILVWDSIPHQSDTPPDFALGQPTLRDVEVNRGGSPALNSLYWPYGIAWIENRLYVTDTGNRRVLYWEGLPDQDCAADGWLGQPTDSAVEENRGGMVAANSFRWPHDIAQVGAQLMIADAGNHRVLGWDTPLLSDRPADFVLGQKDFASAYELPYDAQGPQRLRFPYAIDHCGQLVAVADTANNRILFWKAPLSAPCGSPAIDVLGQPDFAANGENRWQTVNESTLCWPYGLSFHDGKLAIADSGNNRIMIWDCRELIDFVSNEDGSSS